MKYPLDSDTSISLFHCCIVEKAFPEANWSTPTSMKGDSWRIDCYRMCLPIVMSNVGVCWTITKCWWIAWTRCLLMDSDDCTLCLTWVWQGDNGSVFPNAAHRDWTCTKFAVVEQGMKIHENINRRGFKTKWICGKCPRSYVCDLWESKDCMRRVIKCICEKWCPSAIITACAWNG